MRILRLAVASSLALVWATACTAPEEDVLNRFFTAVQGGDEASMSSVSVAEFAGDVESWEVVEVGEESIAPFTLPDVHEKMLKRRSEVRLMNERNANFAADNRSLFDEYKKKRAEDPEATFTGELGEFQTDWEERMAAHAELEKEIAAIGEELKALRSVARLSLNTEVNENFLGDVKDKELHLTVNDGSTDTSYTVTLQRYELTDTERNLTPISRWIITDIKENV